MTKEEILTMIDELRYNIADGIGIYGCKRDFTQHEYDVADGVLKMLFDKVKKVNENETD